MADDFKAEGNALFKAGEFKKAAVAYTKGIKADPSNHILYSNRCAAFLKMLKVSRALRDAETCIELAPEWAKGYYRKAKVRPAPSRLTCLVFSLPCAPCVYRAPPHKCSSSTARPHTPGHPTDTPTIPARMAQVLEATEGRAGEAYDVVVAGLEASPDNADLKNLHRSYTKSRNAAAKRKERERAFAAAALGGSDGGGDQGAASVAATAAVAAETMSQIDLSDMSSGATALSGEQVRFVREIATEIAAGFAEHTDANELFRPSCYLRNNGAEDEDFFQIAVGMSGRLACCVLVRV